MERLMSNPVASLMELQKHPLLICDIVAMSPDVLHSLYNHLGPDVANIRTRSLTGCYRTHFHTSQMDKPPGHIPNSSLKVLRAHTALDQLLPVAPALDHQPLALGHPCAAGGKLLGRCVSRCATPPLLFLIPQKVNKLKPKFTRCCL